MERELGRMLVIGGLIIAVVGVAILAGGRFGLGRLPGDISIRRGNFRFYVPLGTCLLLSVIATVVFRLFGSR